MKQSEVNIIKRLSKIESKKEPWRVGANLVQANINWMEKMEKRELAKFAKAHNISFKEAVKKHLEVARWLEYQTAMEIKGISETGNILPPATFLGLKFPAIHLSSMAIGQLETGRLPTFTKMNEQERAAYYELAPEIAKEYLKRAKVGFFKAGG